MSLQSPFYSAIYIVVKRTLISSLKITFIVPISLFYCTSLPFDVYLICLFIYIADFFCSVCLLLLAKHESVMNRWIKMEKKN